MNLETAKKSDWLYITAPGRLDAFNFEETKNAIESLALKEPNIAIDVSGAHFVSIAMIKFFHALASDLSRRGGRLALIGPTEKMKRQFHIFASLEPFTLYSQNSWDKLVNTNLEGHS